MNMVQDKVGTLIALKIDHKKILYNCEKEGSSRSSHCLNFKKLAFFFSVKKIQFPFLYVSSAPLKESSCLVPGYLGHHLSFEGHICEQKRAIVSMIPSLLDWFLGC
ncbi:hypothetical protein GQ457_08G015770 [Hibiscus cannabinus]